MKKILAIVAITGSLVACKQNKTTDQTRVLSATDSAEFKQFKQWKERKEKAAEKTVVYKPVVSENTGTATTAAPVATKKKGWSKAAKGAVIGGATGAVAGAIITKNNRAAGAVVGGVVGAGVGYGIGRSKDKKDGRY